MKINVKYFLLSALLLVFTVGCQSQDPPVEQVEQSPSSQTEDIAEVPEVTPTPEEIEETPSPEVSLPPANFTETQSITVTCGSVQDFQGVQILAECPTDEDKDDRPDQEFSTITFTNPFDVDLFLVFPDNNTYKMTTVSSSGSIVKQVQNSSFNAVDRTFSNIVVGIGKVQVSAIPENTFSKDLSCKGQVQGNIQKEFGVEYTLSCSPEQTSINLNNSAAKSRVMSVAYVDDEGNQQTQGTLLQSSSNLNIPLPRADNYKLEIVIPEEGEVLMPR